MSENNNPPPSSIDPNSGRYVPRAINWERELLEKLAMENLLEQRRKRRWGIFFKFVAAFYIGFLIFVTSDFGSTVQTRTAAEHTALVELKGVIDSEGSASAERINTSLKAAFDDKRTVGVILKINSPGGSPVQSGVIYDEIQRLRALHPKVPLYVVIEEICASGGYYVAAAADKIFVDKASLVGSIGVLMDGFGFEESLKKLGVERRLLTAGENKGFLDPFSPVSAQQQQHAKEMLSEIHQQFIDAVKKGRGDRLKTDTTGLFSGLVWNGSKSVKIGLADDFGTVDYVAREIIKAEEILDYTQQDTLAERFVKRVGVSFGGSLSQTLLNALQVR